MDRAEQRVRGGALHNTIILRRPLRGWKTRTPRGAGGAGSAGVHIPPERTAACTFLNKTIKRERGPRRLRMGPGPGISW